MKISDIDIESKANIMMDEMDIVDAELRSKLLPAIVLKVRNELDEERRLARNRYFDNKKAKEDAAKALEASKLALAKQAIVNQTLIAEGNKESPAPRTSDVWLSNILNMAAHGLTLNEKRIMMLAATKLLPSDIEPKHSPAITIHSSELTEMFGLSDRAARYALGESGGVLTESGVLKKSNEFLDKKTEKSGLESRKIRWVSYDAKGGRHYTSMSWVPKTVYHENEGSLEIHIWHEVVPLLTNLKKNFTKYTLDSLRNVSSKNTFRLYEILYQYRKVKNKTFELDVESINFMLELGPSYQSNFGLTKAKVLDVAMNELRDVLPFTYKPILIGKKTIAVEFHLMPTDGEKLSNSQDI